MKHLTEFEAKQALKKGKLVYAKTDEGCHVRVLKVKVVYSTVLYKYTYSPREVFSKDLQYYIQES